MQRKHSPTLETVQMVENTIREAKETVTVAELKQRLPRKVNHNTLKTILTYLQESGKIEFTPYGAVWIFSPKEDLHLLLTRGRTWTRRKSSKS
jgi:Mn-dependent DtxR family transcriptional regulator